MYRAGESNSCECGAHCWAKATQYGVVIVDAEDAHLLRDYSWCLMNPRRLSPYAKSYRCKSPTTPSGALLHLAVLNHPEEVIDHIDGNGLDCRKSNLRKATQKQNTHNRRRPLRGKARFKGVSPRQDGRWVSQVQMDGTRKHLGYFDFELDAAVCYNYHAAHLYGGFAKLNAIPADEYAHD